MFSKTKKLWISFKNSAIALIGDLNNSIGKLLKKEEKFFEWARANDYKIEKLEFSSFLEAGFSYWQVPRGHVCAKAILIDQNSEKKGAYLLTGNGQPISSMIVKFVATETLQFNDRSGLDKRQNEF